MRPLLVLGTLAFVSIFAAACAAPSESEPAAEEGDAALAQGTCSREAYSTALGQYKKAASASKKRFAGTHDCDGTTVMDIVLAADLAVNNCEGFRQVIATKKYAQPLREVLKDNIALPLLMGKITVFDAQGNGVWTGLKDSLPGVVLYGPSQGTYGHLSKITFAADGKATLSTREVGDDGPSENWKDSTATYSIGPVNPDHSIQLTLAADDGTSKVYDVNVGASEMSSPFPGTDLVNKTDNNDVFESIPDECSA